MTSNRAQRWCCLPLGFCMRGADHREQSSNRPVKSSVDAVSVSFTSVVVFGFGVTDSFFAAFFAVGSPPACGMPSCMLDAGCPPACGMPSSPCLGESTGDGGSDGTFRYRPCPVIPPLERALFLAVFRVFQSFVRHSCRFRGASTLRTLCALCVERLQSSNPINPAPFSFAAHSKGIE